MNDQITCPHCKKMFAPSQAITHELKEAFEKRFTEERNKLIVLYQKRIREQEEKIVKETEQTLRERIGKEMALSLKDAKNEAEEVKKQNGLLQDQLLEMNKLIRQLKTQSQAKELELEKKLSEEEEKIRAEEKKRIEEEYHLRMLEKEKRLQDALKETADLKRKLEQGSQQTQGEVLELEFENVLKHHFPYDEIRPVAKGVRGGDLVQVVRNTGGKFCGSIMWEFKRTKAWSNGWIQKLKDDQRNVKAEYAVIITNILPPTVKGFAYLEGVWIGEYGFLEGIAQALRRQLIEIARLKSSLDGKQGKMDILFKYLSSTEFTHRVEAIIEAFSSIRQDIQKERDFFSRKWARQEKSIQHVIDNTFGMRGDLESIMGKDLPEMTETPTLPEETDKASNKLFD